MPRKSTTNRKTAAKWKPLELYQHQQDVVAAYESGKRRFFLGWHRRAGKDVFGLDFARNRMYERVGSYWHLFPYHVQAKRAIWKGIDARTGERFIDRAFPKELREAENDTEMSITANNGSSWQMLGSDNYDRMVGSNPCGIIFSEWALCDPTAWEYIRPILMENKGWAMFITTFRGRNHAYRMYETVKDSEDWYADIRTVDDTYRRNGEPIVSKADIEKEIKDGMDPSLVQQEFYCNPDAATTGAIFNRQYGRLTQLDCITHKPDSKSIRIAWGMHDEGIAGIAFRDNSIIAVHTFQETNIIDAVQHVTKRHPHSTLIHHAINADPSVYGDVDGVGVVAASVSSNEHMQHGYIAALLNECDMTSIARERLCDFSMSYAPYRDSLDDTDLTYGAIAQALAVMKVSRPIIRSGPRPPMRYVSDRSVI